MALPTFVAAGTVSASLTAITPGIPAGNAAGDILILAIETSVPGTVTAPGSWAHVTGSPLQVGSDSRLTVLWLRAVGSDAAPTIADTGDHQTGRMIGVRGCITTGNPWDGTPGATTDATRDTAAVGVGLTTTVDECFVVACFGTDVPDSTGTAAFASPVNASLANLAERVDNSSANGDGGAIAIFTGEKATAGVVSATSCTISAAATKCYLTLALKPPTPAVSLLPSLVMAPRIPA